MVNALSSNTTLPATHSPSVLVSTSPNRHPNPSYAPENENKIALSSPLPVFSFQILDLNKDSGAGARSWRVSLVLSSSLGQEALLTKDPIGLDQSICLRDIATVEEVFG